MNKQTAALFDERIAGLRTQIKQRDEAWLSAEQDYQKTIKQRDARIAELEKFAGKVARVGDYQWMRAEAHILLDPINTTI